MELHSVAYFRAADTLATVFWCYALLKLFAFDADYALISAVAPRASWILGYKLLLFVGALTAVSAFLWRLETAVTLVYVATFPFIVFFWKIPHFIAKRRSFAFAIGALNALAIGIRNARYYLVSKGLLAIVAFVILTTSNKVPLVAAGAVSAGLLAWAYVRVIAETFRPSWFLRVQSDGIKRVMNSSFARSFFTIDASVVAKGPGLTDAEASSVVNKVQIAAIMNRGLLSWAYHLRQYKQFQLNLLFNAFAYLMLFALTIFTFFLLNLALLKVAPSQYDYSSHPSNVAVFLYGMSSLFFNQEGGLSPTGDGAYLLRIAAGFFGTPVLLMIVVNALFTWRRERDDASLDDTVSALRATARNQDADFRAVARVSVAEACDILQELQALILVEFFLRGVPPEFLADVPHPISWTVD